MVGQNVGDHSFKKKDHVVTMSNKQSVKVDSENVNLDPQLFQCLVMAAGDDLDVAENFNKYELSTHPSALFEPNGLMREADKSSLADAIWNTAKATEMPTPSNREEMNYVLDGGALIQRLPWSHNVTFDSICNKYVNYVEQKYGNSTSTEFDGVGKGPSTKDSTHLRRSGGIVGVEVKFVGSMRLKLKKKHFLPNSRNKQKFILMVSENLQHRGFQTIYAEGDADLLICQTAADSASRHTSSYHYSNRRRHRSPDAFLFPR